MMKRKLTLLLLLIFSLLVNAGNFLKREMRAVWIATVVNIDWPSRSGLTVNMQKDEMIRLLDIAKEFKLNTVVFQVRPASDAFYPSKLEPWSEWLTGEQGKAPDPFYDPLEFMIKESRKRGLEVHLWLNPYRAVKDTSKNSVSDDHPIKSHPEWFVTYGKTSYYNPGLPETRDHVASVVADILKRYKVDAIHFDDYFYPYRIPGKDFPDEETFKKYPNGFALDKKDDWRRNNVDLIIKQLHDTIDAISPNVAFGISPFGVWRNKSKDARGSDTKAGQTNYDDLYADILKWQEKGWIDYVTPQIYWHIGKESADYAKLLVEWWSENALGCRLYIGQAFYRIDKKSKDKEWRSAKQLVKQINLNRAYPNVDGSMFFSAKWMKINPLGIEKKLQKKLFRYEALPPVNPRVKQVEPEVPHDLKMKVSGNKIELTWKSGKNNRQFVLYRFRYGKPASVEDATNIVMVTGENRVSLELNKKNDLNKVYFVLSALSPTNIESVPEYFRK